MYMRKTTKISKGKTYTHYLLVESVHTPKGPALSTSSLLDELPERRPMTVVLVSGAWRQYCCATA
jgi:hypothetical protein